MYSDEKVKSGEFASPIAKVTCPGRGVRHMFRSGGFVSRHVSPVTDDQIQPNGVDISLDAVYQVADRGAIECNDKTIADREEIDPTDGTYELSPGSYIVTYEEEIAVPAGHIGFILPRSSLLRNGTSLHTAVWDTGYRGRGEGLLVAGAPIDIERSARIGQFVLAGADHRGEYDGSYQGERLD